ncbi:MAG: 6-phosphogluconolactonase [gamma proteobacterium endosymbiont of Lamellibrachia anaximandri]|nr:6-phosphogluconolactonase [gamma proteobacterium endosymbiont of Lamellibrachia anaximandri]MBL3533400.1 6-phosphogluconolactonase [gamma proteobacterium endosymbiont of Lamellibrachia anaximandri]MBL3598826.1 6-phosphogluconolactonase [gamma proteobacterium endosymbiont of Lamellibrachia anaximandri]
MAGERIIIDGARFVLTASQWILDTIETVLQHNERCHLMLAGGGTPMPVYRKLSQQEIPWEKITIFFGDERCVPPTHEASNYRAALEALFPRGLPDDLILHRMHGEDDPETAAEAYEAILPEQIDILLLGLGEDGHTASLFPDSDALEEWQRRIIPVVGSKPPPQRLTITPAVVRSAKHTLMMVEGDAKADAVRRALEVGDVPATLASEATWLIDRAAALALSE